jgi:KDO2-lipid IV(A) lauroyltransferase
MLILLRLLSRFPLPLLHAAGALLGAVALLRSRNRLRMRNNLISAGQYRASTLLRASMELGKNLAELPLIWLAPLPQVYARVREVEGWEHIDAAQQRGQGVILLAPHMGCWEICGMYLASRIPCTALYTPPKQGWAHDVMRAGRERSGIQTVPPGTSGVRALLNRLRAGEAVFILPDQVANVGEGMWLRFLGTAVYMPVLPYRLLDRTGATPLLVFAERLSLGRGYRLKIAPLPPSPAAGLEAQAQTACDAMTGLIRTHASQYLWNYGLFRRRKYMPPLPDHLL